MKGPNVCGTCILQITKKQQKKEKEIINGDWKSLRFNTVVAVLIHAH